MKERQNSIIKPNRTISKKITLILYVHAGGRCEFDGCNRYLLEHYPTEMIGNFAEQAHIWAFSERGPRGSELGRPDDINNLQNLMLLCKDCHELVDRHPEKYTVETLKKFKEEHENRVFTLTGISKDRDTIPLVIKAQIAGRLVDISNEEMQTAVAPNYLKQRDKIEIDLRAIPDIPDDSFWKTSASIIDQKVGRLYSLKPKPDCTLRVSVFGLAPIPLLIYLGSKLSDKLDVDLYQRHRDTESWSWKDGNGTSSYITRCILRGQKDEQVSLLVNLTGRNGTDVIPINLTRDGTVYELTLNNQECSPLFLNTREDLIRFTREYNNALAIIRETHPLLDTLHIFPAVPAPVAITLGRSRLPKVDPKFKVYDYDKRVKGFVPTVDIS
jgi:hypothetical protein